VRALRWAAERCLRASRSRSSLSGYWRTGGSEARTRWRWPRLGRGRRRRRRCFEATDRSLTVSCRLGRATGSAVCAAAAGPARRHGRIETALLAEPRGRMAVAIRRRL
jgi:hypothetical protein